MPNTPGFTPPFRIEPGEYPEPDTVLDAKNKPIPLEWICDALNANSPTPADAQAAFDPWLIWWTNQADCERIVPLDTWPTYLYDEYQSRLGRAGRGRLWIPEIDGAPTHGVAVEWDDNNNWLCKAANDAAGIVFKAEHLDQVQFLPGFVSTFTMELPR